MKTPDQEGGENLPIKRETSLGVSAPKRQRLGGKGSDGAEQGQMGEEENAEASID